MIKRKQRIRVTGWSVGALATAAVLGLYGAGWLDGIEFKTLDWRFRWTNNTPADSRIVCIDIDDGSLEKVGRWPWPRDVQAGVLGVLAELGPKAILYDVTLSDPEPVRTIVPQQADFVGRPERLVGQDVSVALPDLELQSALREAGCVYLAFDYGGGASAKAAAAAPAIGDRALRERVQRWLSTQPPAEDPPTLFAGALRAFPEDNPEALALALRQLLSMKATLDTALARGRWPELAAIHDLAPTYFPLAQAARRCGFVVFDPERDGVMRQMPLVVRYQDYALPQLAFAVAVDQLQLAAPDQWRWRQTWGWHELSIPGLPPMQTDDTGRVLVPWLPQRDWAAQFGQHIPADALWQVWDRRQKLQQNDELLAATLAPLTAAGPLAEFAQYVDDLRQVARLQGELRLARYQERGREVLRLRGALAEYAKVRAEDEPKLRANVAALLAPGASSASAAAPVDNTQEALHTVARALAANDGFHAEIDATLKRLQPRVRGSLCLVGYTATALADMTPIPTHPRAPGVIAHANLLNGLLLGKTVSWLPGWLNGLIVALAGLLATRVAMSRGARLSALLIMLLAATCITVACFAFYSALYWVALVPPLAAIGVSTFAVVLYRYAFLERESRQIAHALGQYTSATLARQMAEDAELCKRAEMREVTAVFTDLAGFTSISERIGAQRTQHVLNVALGRFSDVMFQHEAMVNKFIGDGIFAFWNPVIYPQPDHALRACETAVDLMVALRELMAEQSGGVGDEVFAELVLRIGVATGNAIVGPCGSEKKYDYTCIGDSVNVASRLESANKFYGTRILISGATYAGVSERFVVRPLGGVQVKGKTQAVPIYELLGRAGAVAGADCAYAARFGAAVARFRERAWSEALTAFRACLTQRPDDLAAVHYVEAAERFLRTPPPDDWNSALELSEK